MPHSLPRALLLGLALAGPAAYGESRDDAPARADIFDVIDWPGIFGVTPTPLPVAFRETFLDPVYARIQLEF